MESAKKPASDLIKPERPRAMVFAIISEPADNFVEIGNARAHHMAYLSRLDRQGVLIGAGPTLDSTGEYYEGAGLLIIRAENIAVARSLAESDPFHQQRIRKFKLKPWLLSEGDMFLAEREGTSLRHSNQTGK